MSAVRQILFVLGLGTFWGASPALNKALGLAGVPVTHILVASGLGVGPGLMLLQWLSGGRLRVSWPVVVYGLGCGVLINIPWTISLAAIRHMPVALSAVMVSTTPLWTYAFALSLGRDTFSPLRLLALVTGLASSAAVILTRPGASLAAFDIWVLATLSLPLLYAAYNVFTSAAWPKGMDPLTAGVAESFAAGLLGLPFLLYFNPPTGQAFDVPTLGYLLLLAVTLMWVLERVCYFRMIERFGPVTTVQAVYVSTPASVLLGLLMFRESADAWLWLSLALLMLALWLNNRALSNAKQAEHQPLQQQHAQPVAAINDGQ